MHFYNSLDVTSLFDVYCELNFSVSHAENQKNQNLKSIAEKFPTNFRDDKILKMLQLFASTPRETAE